MQGLLHDPLGNGALDLDGQLLKLAFHVHSEDNFEDLQEYEFLGDLAGLACVFALLHGLDKLLDDLGKHEVEGGIYDCEEDAHGNLPAEGQQDVLEEFVAVGVAPVVVGDGPEQFEVGLGEVYLFVAAEVPSGFADESRAASLKVYFSEWRCRYRLNMFVPIGSSDFFIMFK